jgi:hypothetical protein
LETPISIFHYANKPLLAIYKVLFENYVYYENCIPYCSEMFCSILGKFIIWFESFWSQNAKDMNKSEKQKRENDRIKKISKRAPGTNFCPAAEEAHGLSNSILKWYPCFSSHPPRSGTHLSSLSSSRNSRRGCVRRSNFSLSFNSVDLDHNSLPHLRL